MRKAAKPYVAVFAAVLSVFTAFFFAASPLFSVETVKVEGLSALTENEVLLRGGLPPYGSKNFFLINSVSAEKKISELPYADKCDVVKVFPNSVTVRVTERRVCGYVEDAGFFIYLDGEGRALETSESVGENLPVAVGLKYASFKLGEKLKVPNPDVFNALAVLGSLFRAYDLSAYYVRANINDPSDIRLYLRGIEITMGGLSEINDRTRVLKEVLENFPDLENARGTLDLNTTYKNISARFKPIR